MEETLTVTLQLLEELFTYFLERFYVDYVTFGIHLVVELTFVGIVGLALLFMFVQPFSRDGLGHGY